jgi:TetR/AcrR family transcriptional repressor of nem operon
MAAQSDVLDTAPGSDEGSKPRGRPRRFDRDEVLDQVVQLFWTQGFEATGMAEISAATGLNKSSLYNTFGSKEALLEAALERYLDLRLGMISEVLTDGTVGLDDLATMFALQWEEICGDFAGRGCLAVNTATELGLRAESVRVLSERFRSGLFSALSDVLGRAADLGEIDRVMVDSYAEMIMAFTIALAVVVRSGAESGEIERKFAAMRLLVDSWRIS